LPQFQKAQQQIIEKSCVRWRFVEFFSVRRKGQIQQSQYHESGLFLEEPTISPKGHWLAYCRSNGGSSLWLAEDRKHSAAGSVMQHVALTT
jgi:hypothetical protein